ncbi:MAG TPA: hypothetical protein VHM23_09015 [Actinomycetota bacterium]|nr:hypothetical protein [Actinomycetota bacterium]
MIWTGRGLDAGSRLRRVGSFPQAQTTNEDVQASETAGTALKDLSVFDDWASWYANWLVTLSELPELLGAKVVRSELTWLLVRLDKEYSERRPDQRWEDWYA